jgi:hypothetical protein
MTDIQNQKRYDMEERALIFAKRTRVFVGKLPKNHIEHRGREATCSLLGLGRRDYIEANESH